ncbi:MAG TPA: hypothetical protein VK888_02605, partial [Anaerolineales bacterium]|nr:hypothetical protein [Anaerolineales bacterium]
WDADPKYIGWGLVIAYAAATLYGLRLILRDKQLNYGTLAVVAYVTFNIIYFTIMANFTDLGENNRFRFALDPLVLLLFGALVQNSVLHWWKKKNINPRL